MNKRIWFIKTIMAFLFCSILAAQSTSYHAVCVGIRDYQDNQYDIADNDCVNDATDMRIYLMNYQDWDSDNIELILNSDATEGYITSCIENMPNSTGNSELFFYSGHGQSDGLLTYASTLLSPSDLQSAFGSNFNQYCCFLNACHSGVFVNQMSKGEISSAVTSNELAYTGGPDDNSIYSYFILEGIKNNQADPQSGHVVSAKEIHDYAAQSTTDYAADSLLVNMHPQFKGNLRVLNLANLGPTTSGTLTDSELWDNNVTLNDDVTVPSNVILSIYGATVNLNGHSIIFTEGTISNQGTISGIKAYLKEGSTVKGYCGSLQSAVDNWGSGQYVSLLSGTTTESFNIDDKDDIEIRGNNSTIFGAIELNNTSDALLFDFNISGGSLELNSSNSAAITGIDFIDSMYPLTSYNSSASYYMTANNSYSVNDVAAYLYGSDGTIVDESEIKYHTTAMGLYNNSSFDVVYTEFCHNTWDIYADGSSYAVANGCTFSGDPATTTYGDVDIYDYSTCGSLKRGAVEENTPVSKKDDPAFNDFVRINKLYSDLRKEIIKSGDSNREKYKEEIETIKNQFKSFIKTNPNSELSKTALTTLTHIYKQNNEFEEMKANLLEVATNKEQINISGLAKRYIIDYYTHKKDYAMAITTADEILKENEKDENLICDVLYAKGLIFKYSLNKKEEAIAVYASILENYPENAVVRLASRQLTNLGQTVPEAEPKIAAKENTEVGFSSGNYPNPFNPSTTISYAIPEDGKVQIKVFDVLGKEVTKLVDGFVNAGKHNVVWNGNSFASGIYFYTITFKGQSINKKVLLVK